MSQFTPDYQNFFLKSNAGKQFMEFVNGQIEAGVARAMVAPESARDEIQGVKGFHEIKKHIDSVCEVGRSKE